MSDTTNAATTAQRDQYIAATKDARRTVREMAGADPLATFSHHPSAWAKARIADLMRAVATGQARACRHLTGSARVVCSVAWYPGVVVCGLCTPTLSPHHDDDGRCDRCAAATEAIHIQAVQAGPLIYVYGLCKPCNDTTEETR